MILAWTKKVLGITKLETEIAQIKADVHGFKNEFDELKRMINHMNGNMENRNKLIIEMYNELMDKDKQ